MKAIPIFILSAILAFSHTSCCHEIQCINSTAIPIIELDSFSLNELDTVIIKKFPKGSNFNSPIDSMVLDSNNRVLQTDSISRCFLYEHSPDIIISPDYDFEIFVPATNTLAKIESIDEPQTQEKVCPGSEYTITGCYNHIVSYKLNGVIFLADGYSTVVITK